MPEPPLSAADRDAVYEVLARYLWCMDNADIDGVVATFTPGGVVKDITGRLWDGPDAPRAFASHFLTRPGQRGGQHWVQHLAVEPADGGACRVTSYWFGARPGVPPSIGALGTYVDTVVPTAGGWLISEKRIDPWNSGTVAPGSRQPLPAALGEPDRHALFDLLYRYAYCLDTADGEGLAATFARDGVIETAGGSFRGRDALVEFTATAVANQPGFFGRQHHVQPVTLVKTPAGYDVTAYWRVITWPAGGEASVILMGYYEDTCVLEDGAWRFKRKVIKRWDSETAPIAGR